MSIGDMLCARCFAVLPKNEPPAVDLYGGPICRECHRKEWELREIITEDAE